MKAAVTNEDHGFDVVDMPIQFPHPTSCYFASQPAASAGRMSKPSRSHRRGW